MLLDNFYSIIDQCEINGANAGADNPLREFIFTLKLNPDHPVYDGHFPGNPIVPGACQVQMIKELASSAFNKNMVINRSDSIKFLSMIVPAKETFLKVNIEIKVKDPDFLHVTSAILRDDQVCLKFKGIMVVQ